MENIRIYAQELQRNYGTYAEQYAGRPQSADGERYFNNIGIKGVQGPFQIKENHLFEITPIATGAKMAFEHNRTKKISRVSSLMFQFLDQNRYNTSFRALIIMSLQDMLT